jgi:hypothetical protein
MAVETGTILNNIALAFLTIPPDRPKWEVAHLALRVWNAELLPIYAIRIVSAKRTLLPL